MNKAKQAHVTLPPLLDAFHVNRGLDYEPGAVRRCIRNACLSPYTVKIFVQFETKWCRYWTRHITYAKHVSIWLQAKDIFSTVNMHFLKPLFLLTPFPGHLQILHPQLVSANIINLSIEPFRPDSGQKKLINYTKPPAMSAAAADPSAPHHYNPPRAYQNRFVDAASASDAARGSVPTRAPS